MLTGHCNAGGMVEYRRSLAASFLFRFFVDVALKLEKEGSGYKAADWLPAGHESAAVHFERPASQGVQYFNKVGEQDVVGQPVRHMAADLQARPCQLLQLHDEFLTCAWQCPDPNATGYPVFIAAGGCAQSCLECS